jgi:hypothetical protein
VDLNGRFGVSAMVRLALLLENEWDMDVLSIGRECFDRKDSCTLSVTGKWLGYCVMIDGGFVFVSAQLMDFGDPPQLLATFGDTVDGWVKTCSLIQALERAEVKSLQRPIEAGTGSSGWVIA